MRELLCETHGVANGNICGPNCKISRKQASFGSLRPISFFTKMILLLFTIVTAGGMGYVLGTFNQTITGPAPSGTVTISPNPVSFNSVSMNWATGVLSISLTSTASISGTCTAVFNPGSISTTASYSFTGAATTSFNFNPVSFTVTPTSISISC